MNTTKSIQTFVVNNQYSTVQYNKDNHNNNNWDTHWKSHERHSMYFYMVNQASFSDLNFTCCFFRNHFSSHCPRDFVLFNTYYIGDQIWSSNVHKGPRELVIAWNNCRLISAGLVCFRLWYQSLQGSSNFKSKMKMIQSGKQGEDLEGGPGCGLARIIVWLCVRVLYVTGT